MYSFGDVRVFEHSAREDRVDVIRVRGLSKFSLHALDLRVAAGERVAVIGRTGEGKSVLLKCITGVLRPDSGRIEVMGRGVAGSVLSIEGAGVAFQNCGLFDAYSVRGNVELAAGRRLSDREMRLLLDSLELAIDPDSSVSGLSGGQAKRLALLRAIVRGHGLVIMDEPTAGLDPATSERVADVLCSALAKDDRAVLLVTHDYETAARLCDRFYLLNAAGTLEEVGVPRFGPIDEKVRCLRDALARRGEQKAAIERRPPRKTSAASLTAALVADSVPVALAAMALLGALLVKQSSGISPIDISRHVPAIVVWAVFREIAPLVAGLLLAGRVAAKIAAEVGGMSYTAQIASMRVLGLSPAKQLYVPFAVSAAVVFPICIVAGACAAIAAAAGFAAMPFSHLSIGANRFISLAADAFTPQLVISCVIKGVLMALVVATIAYRSGVSPLESAQAVGSAVTRSVVIGSVAVVAADVAVSLLIF